MARSKLSAPWNEHLADVDPDWALTREGMKSMLARADRAASPHGEFLKRRGLLDPDRIAEERALVKRIRKATPKRREPRLPSDVPEKGAPVTASKKGAAPLRERVYERDGYRCVICKASDPNYLTLDHWVPRSRGGTNKLDNLRTMCRACNHSKGDMLPEEWEASPKYRGKRSKPTTPAMQRALRGSDLRPATA